MHLEVFLLALLIYFALGIGAGLLSGLLGAGGGLIVVPGLIFVFQWEPVSPAVAMHVAVGTSLATMIPIAYRSLTSHVKHGISFFSIYKQMAPTVILGVIGGGILARFIHSHVLEIIFGIFVLVMAASLLIKHKTTVERKLPGWQGMLLAGGFVGLQSGMLGVGGSAFSVPFLSHRGVNIHVAVVVSVAIAMTVSVLGTITFMLSGLDASGLPHWSTGFVYWPAFIGLAVGGVLMAPLGAKLSHRIPAETLKKCFAVFLLVIAAHMLWL
ncbi:MAG: hypothetical protein A3F13_06340 [Gammaproteobacteria bacterium RIFCSPHIGHO2_12_FULL_40_19]|nr:MAG: hypothetical protein A3F13_06340 [Gammaproteobacteria bacterium RIFCSPHIGHO2_12_FULL_40_19]